MCNKSDNINKVQKSIDDSFLICQYYLKSFMIMIINTTL